ncbi:hypothetical protein Slin14017_G063190 [Septoria linicola]|nr:hypothetical protein Slin14017_G063190 [Septoria linicola]
MSDAPEKHGDTDEARLPLVEDHRMNSDRTRQRRQLYKYLLASLALLLIAILALTTIHIGHPSTLQAATYQDCGSSPTTARQRHCSFDILSFAWQTLECYDHNNTQAFLRHNGPNTTWNFYTKLHRTSPQYTEAEILSGEFAAYVDANYHYTHCTYMWRQLHRAYTLKGYVDMHLDHWNHTLHCQMVLLNVDARESALREVNTLGRVIYPRCRKIW